MANCENCGREQYEVGGPWERCMAGMEDPSDREVQKCRTLTIARLRARVEQAERERKAAEGQRDAALARVKELEGAGRTLLGQIRECCGGTHDDDYADEIALLTPATPKEHGNG